METKKIHRDIAIDTSLSNNHTTVCHESTDIYIWNDLQLGLKQTLIISEYTRIVRFVLEYLLRSRDPSHMMYNICHQEVHNEGYRVSTA